MLSVYFLISIMFLSIVFCLGSLWLFNRWGQHDERRELAVIIALLMLVFCAISATNLYRRLEEIDKFNANANIEQRN